MISASVISVSKTSSNGASASTFGAARSTGATCGGRVDSVPSKCLRPMMAALSKRTVAKQIACGCLKRMEFTCTIISIVNIASNLSGNRGKNLKANNKGATF